MSTPTVNRSATSKERLLGGLLHAPQSLLRSPDRRLSCFLGLGAAGAFLLVQEGFIAGSDGQAMYQVARSLTEQGDLSVPTAYGTEGVGGQFYGKYGIGLSLLAVPFYAAGRVIAGAVPGSADLVTHATVASLSPLIAVGLVVAMFLLARRLGGSTLSSLITAIGAVVGTYTVVYTKEFFSEPLTALGLVVSFERALADRPAQSGWGLAVAALARPQSFLLAPVVAAVLWWRRGLRRSLGFAWPVVAAVGLTLTYNFVRFEAPFRFGYRDEGFFTPIGQGLQGLLLHPSKSLLLFAPIVLLTPPAVIWGWQRNKRDAVVLLIGNFVVTLVLAATWHSWTGGWSWGPRLLIPGMLPLLASIAPWVDARPRRMRLVAALAALGFLVSAPSLVVSSRAQQLDRPPPAIGPRVLRQVELVPQTVDYTLSHLTSYDRDQGLNYRYLTLWQIGVVRAVGHKGWLIAVPISTVLVAVTAASGRALASELRSCETARGKAD